MSNNTPVSLADKTDLSFDELCKARAQEKKKYYDDAHWQLTGQYVTLAKRNAGDYLGNMRVDRSHRNVWNGVLSGGFFTYPVVHRAIRSKTSTAIATDIKLDIKPVLTTPEKKAAAEMAQNCYDYCETHYWTERLETLLAMLGQIGRFAVIRTEAQHGCGLKVGEKDITKPGWYKTKDTQIACKNCGSLYSPEDLKLSPMAAQAPGETEGPSGAQTEPQPPEEYARHPMQGAPDAETQPEKPADPEWPDEIGSDMDDSAAPNSEPPAPAQYDVSGAVCQNPNCVDAQGQKFPPGHMAVMNDEAHEYGEYPTGEKEAVMAAKIKQTVDSPLLYRFDDIHTIGFDWQAAHWVNFHPLESRYELLDAHPELKDELVTRNYTEWSESTRWYYELSKGDGNIGKPGATDQPIYEELVEVDYWWYQPVMCNGWAQPEGSDTYQLTRKGEVVFDIKPGETPEQAFKRREPDAPFRGLMVKMCSDAITDVQNMSFLDTLTFVGWSISVTTHVPDGEERLINIQDAATRVFSNLYLAVQRSTNAKGVVDGRFFNVKEFLDNNPGKWIQTKQDIDADDKGTGDVTARAGYIQPPQVSNMVQIFVELLIEIIKEETGIYDETVGNANSQNQTKGGRELALDQSLSLQGPMAKTKKEGKIAWAMLMLKLWQQFPDEAFVLIKGEFDDEWKVEDIAAFKDLDIEAELLITAVAGSDVPKTRSAMVQNISIAAQLGLFMPDNPIPPELTQRILKEFLGIDYDFQNIEADRRLAATRLDRMMEMAAKMAEMAGGWDQLIVLKMLPEIEPNVPAPDAIPTRVLHPDLVLMIAQDIRTKVRPDDAHPIFVAYYVDQVKGTVGRKHPREVDVLILENAIDQHNQMVNTMAVQQMKAQALATQAMTPPAPADPNAAPPGDTSPLEQGTGPKAKAGGPPANAATGI